MPRIEVLTLVIYDISDDRTRTKVSETCLDYGLHRIQYSAFEGLLTRNRLEELALRLADELRESGGKVTLIPICHSDADKRIDLDIGPAATSSAPRRPLELRVFVEEEDA
jgi:CRISPR-associated protein Cas2